MAHRPLTPLSTFAIGSLPHTQLELALQSALRSDVPALPQLPRTSASEFMLAQSLEGFPGLSFGSDGRTVIDPEIWAANARPFGDRLERALSDGGDAFEPTPTSTRAWLPFLWEVEQRKVPFAKAQLAGPITSVWATTLADGSPLSSRPEIAAQVVKLVLARALAMTRALSATGATPVVFLDEPGLYAYDKRRPAHFVDLQELRFAAAALRKAGALVGVHCCGNTDWSAIFGLPIDIVSADVRLSLSALLSAGDALDAYLARGGWLGLGIVPTNVAERVPVEEMVAETLALLGPRREILSHALLSPACGLALRSVAEAEQAGEDLRTAQRLLAAAR